MDSIQSSNLPTSQTPQESENHEFGDALKTKTSSLTPSQATFAFDSQGNPIPPLRPLSSFSIFEKDHTQQTKEENPHLPTAEIRKLLAKRWAIADAETKADYMRRNEEAKALYEQRMAQFEAIYGKVKKNSTTVETGSE